MVGRPPASGLTVSSTVESALGALLDSPDVPLSEGDLPPARRQAIQKVNYSHDGMIDLIIARRGISQNELAATFGYSPSWISTVMQSDAFQDRLRARTAELVDPTIIATVDAQLKGIVARSIELVKQKLDQPDVPDQFILRSLELSSRALGLGVKPAVVVNNNVSMEAHLDNLGSRLEGLLAKKKGETFEAQPGSAGGQDAALPTSEST